MNNRIKAICTVPLPYPNPRAEKPDLSYARMLSVAYAGQSGELASVLQYRYAHVVCRGIKPKILSEVFSYIAETEMRHLELLGALICALGGAPRFQSDRGAFSATGLQYAVSPEKLLAAAVEREKNAVALYDRLIKNIKDASVTAVLLRIAKDEAHHMKIFEELIAEMA